MGAGELLTKAGGFGVDDEVDVTLTMQRDVLAAVFGDGRKAHAVKQASQQLGVGRRVFDKLETIGRHRVGPRFSHRKLRVEVRIQSPNILARSIAQNTR